MNRFSSGYDDLFAAFGIGSGEHEDAGGAGPNAETPGDQPPAPQGDVHSVDDPEDLAEFLGQAMDALGERSRTGRTPRRTTRPSALSAPVDVVEVAEGLLMVFDLPGVAEADVELAAAPRAIRLRASRRLPLPPSGQALRRERTAGTVERIVPVPPGFDSGSLEARLAAGVLAVMVPRHESTGRDEGEQQGGTGLWNEG